MTMTSWTISTDRGQINISIKMFRARAVAFTTRYLSASRQQIRVPSLGDSIVEGQVVEISLSPGDTVRQDDVVAVLETDKVSVDVTSEYSGVVKQILAAEGEVLPIGAPLLEVSTGTLPSDSTEATEAAEAPEEPKEEQKLLSKAYKPMIQFRYGTNKMKQVEVISQALKEAAPEATLANVDFLVPSPILSEEEIEAVMSGGASLL